jgi:ribosomal protein S27AE
VPRSGHPDLLRGDLIVEAVLAGWEHRCGQTALLGWARERLYAIEREALAPIDWSVRCPASRCPRSGTATALADAAAGRGCPACGAPLVVAAHGVPARELELELRGGAWWLGRRRA